MAERLQSISIWLCMQTMLIRSLVFQPHVHWIKRGEDVDPHVIPLMDGGVLLRGKRCDASKDMLHNQSPIEYNRIRFVQLVRMQVRG